MNISIRDVDDDVFLRFKAEAAREGEKLGQAVSRALNRDLSLKQPKKRRLRFLDLKPIDFGPGSEHSSRDIDHVVYGGKRPK